MSAIKPLTENVTRRLAVVLSLLEECQEVADQLRRTHARDRTVRYVHGEVTEIVRLATGPGPGGHPLILAMAVDVGVQLQQISVLLEHVDEPAGPAGTASILLRDVLLRAAQAAIALDVATRHPQAARVSRAARAAAAFGAQPNGDDGTDGWLRLVHALADLAEDDRESIGVPSNHPNRRDGP